MPVNGDGIFSDDTRMMLEAMGLTEEQIVEMGIILGSTNSLLGEVRDAIVEEKAVLNEIKEVLGEILLALREE